MKKYDSHGICPFRIKNGKIQILLAKPTKSFKNNEKWGFLKGRKENQENSFETAVREFMEESGGCEVIINKNDNVHFSQLNYAKNITIWIAEWDQNSDKNKSMLNEKNNIIDYKDHENKLIKFFDIDDLPEIFLNQNQLLDNIIDYLRFKLRKSLQK